MSGLKIALPALIGIYLLSPVDFIPDVMLDPGQMDDLGVVTAGVLILARLLPWLAPSEVVSEHLREMGMSQPTANHAAGHEQDIVEARFVVRG